MNGKEGGETVTLTKEEIKSLEAKYGKHNFCYQCGNPDIKPIGKTYDPNLYRCPKCGSSDLDE